MWDDLVRGAIGAVVLVDTRRLEDCFGPIDFFEARNLPFIVAINAFDGLLRHRPEEVREDACSCPTTSRCWSATPGSGSRRSRP